MAKAVLPLDKPQQAWKAMRSGPHWAMDELMELRGMVPIKERVLDLYKTVRMERLLRKEQRVTLTLNLYALGVPNRWPSPRERKMLQIWTSVATDHRAV